ncbi:MAG: hypothetical protein IJW00_08055 [Clostridia bacterium]|nr:hypothetical protein [Clostridia bacterium]
MGQETRDTVGKETNLKGKGKRSLALSDIIVVAVILILVITLLLMGNRTCSVTLPANMEDGAEWVELVNEEKVALLTDKGYTSETEYTFKYKTAQSSSSVIIVYAYRDTKTGDEMAERVAYEFTTNAFGFISVRQVEVPKDTNTTAETE